MAHKRKRYRIWFYNGKYVVGVGKNKEEAIMYAKMNKKIGNRKIKSVTLASR